MIRKARAILNNEYVYSILTKTLSILIGIVQSILLARYLGAELKGINAYITSVASVAAIVITFGMHQAYPYLRKKYGKDAIYNEYVTLVMMLYLAFLLTAIATNIIIQTSIEIKSIIIIVPLLGYAQVVEYINLIEAPNKKNRWWVIINFCEIIYLIILFIFTNRNINWSISILLFTYILRCIVYTLMLGTVPRYTKNIPSLFCEILKFGFFPMIALLMTSLNYRIDVMMLHRYDYISDSMIGIYSLGLTLSDKIVLIPDTLKGILVSKLAKGADNEEVAKVLRIGLWASISLCAVIILIGKPVINLLYGAEYAGAYSIVTITAAGTLAIVYFKIIAQYNIVNKKQILNVYMLSIAVVVDIVFNLFFIPIWGIQGAALATSIGNIICGVVYIIYFRSVSNIPIRKMIFIQETDIKFFLKQK